MDSSLYKDIQTSRGFSYHYLAIAPQGDKPYLLFIHGFPSTSYDWRHQIAYFSELGYGLIVPDMLGYGGTAKPTEVEAYTNSRTAKDLIDILDVEGITKCIAIGHDWGSRVASRLADLYEDRFIAFAFLALGYIAPCPNFDMDEVLALTKKLAGYELLGYWKFFGAPDGAEIIEKNLRSFYSALYPDDPEVWRKHFAPLGAFRAWVESGQTTAIGSWLSNEDQKIQNEALLKGGMAGPLSWYKVWTSGLTAEEDKGTINMILYILFYLTKICRYSDSLSSYFEAHVFCCYDPRFHLRGQAPNQSHDESMC
ncbi:hypothetical protein PTI98_000517 [Pleurotus ostreatus]|nr:hypothetical protein PTI98_000517 [Pleurotus ostreatus]